MNFLLLKESKKNVSRFPQKYEAAQLFWIFIIIRNVSWAANQHNSNDFWRSCDTEDWSNDAENTALCHRNKLYFKIIKIENSYVKL